MELSGRIVALVAEHEDTNGSKLPLLGDSIDVDALGDLYDSSDELEVAFRYMGCRIEINPDRSVRVS